MEEWKSSSEAIVAWSCKGAAALLGPVQSIPSRGGRPALASLGTVPCRQVPNPALEVLWKYYGGTLEALWRHSGGTLEAWRGTGERHAEGIRRPGGREGGGQRETVPRAPVSSRGLSARSALSSVCVLRAALSCLLSGLQCRKEEW